MRSRWRRLNCAATRGENGGLRAVCSIRAPEIAIASWMDTFGFSLEESIGTFKAWFAMYRSIAPYCLTVDYASIERRPLEAASAIAGYLRPGTPVDDMVRRYTKAEVATFVGEIDKHAPTTRDIGFSYYDETTFFHRRYVGELGMRLAESTLTLAEIEVIVSELYGAPPR